MQELGTVCLLNDSFPPLIDGVSNTVCNYARCLPDEGYGTMVVTPEHPQAKDDGFSYLVLRYPSIQTQRFEGYPAGIPFSPEIAESISKKQIALLHSHCPVMSTFMARQLRQVANAPLVLTYHTKFDVDIANITKNRVLQEASKKILVANMEACDEIWVVSHGAGENMQRLGVERDYVVMPNGVDLPRGRATQAQIGQTTAGFDLPQDVPVYLFVGRMMWYKGLRLIIDALARLNREERDFRMVFVGDGEQRQQVQDYARQMGLGNKCIFTGAIHDREQLRAWYTRADLFLFPSSYDTNGLVVREAAACDLATVMIRGSCAAEGVSHGRNGFLIEETAESLAACLRQVNREQLSAVGQKAGEELYLSWNSAVHMAAERYQVVLDRYQSGACPRHRRPMDGLMKCNGELMEILGKLSRLRREE